MTDDFGSSVLRKAAGSLSSNDHTQLAILNLILKHSDAAKLLAMDSQEHQAISQAASRGFTACVKRLLEAYRPENRQKSATSALFGAAEGGHALATEALIVAGATSLANLETGTPSALEVSLSPHCNTWTATHLLLCCSSNQQGPSSTSQASHASHLSSTNGILTGSDALSIRLRLFSRTLHLLFVELSKACTISTVKGHSPKCRRVCL